jgi:hypothetical protein
MRVHRLDAEAPCTFAFALVPFGADHPIFGADDPKSIASHRARLPWHLGAESGKDKGSAQDAQPRVE